MSRCVGECHSEAQFAASKVKGKTGDGVGKRFEGMEDGTLVRRQARQELRSQIRPEF